MEVVHTPAEYRLQAERLRTEAKAVTSPDLRDELLRLAAAFERLAERARRGPA